MPNWKKLIVSGSDALLNSLNVSNDLTVSGDIAVGSSPPSSAALGVDGNIKGTGYLLLNDSNNQYIYATPTGRAVEIFASSSVTSGDPAFRIRQDNAAKVDFGWDDDGTSEAFVWNYSNGGFKIGTNNTERLKITADGKVGIGFTSPVNQLDVNGVIMGTGIRFGSQASGEGIMRVNGTGNGNGLALTTGNFSSNYVALYVDHSSNNGKVGIGTTAPTKQLQVVGDISGSDVYINGWNSVSASLSTHAQSLVNNIDGSGTANYVARFSDSNTLTTGLIQDNGTSVGINAGPSSKTLYVDGTGQFTGEVFVSHLDIMGSNASRLRDDVILRFGTNRRFGLTYNSTADKLQFVSSSDTIISVDGDGNTGIEGDLTVNGTITLSESSNEIIKSNGSVRINIDSNNDQTDRLFIVSSGANSEAFRITEAGYATAQAEIKSQVGILHLGDDVTIFRDGANILRTDDALHANNSLYVGGDGKMYDRANFNNFIELADTINISTDTSVTGDLTVTGNITAQEFHTEFVSASIVYQSGSTKFGDTSDDKHSFTGSIALTGSGITIKDPATPALNLIDETNNLSLKFRVANTYGYIDVDQGDSVGSSRLLLRTDGSPFLYGTNNQDIFIPSGSVAIGYEGGSPTTRLHLSGSTAAASGIRQSRAGVKIWTQEIDSNGKLQWAYRATEGGSATQHLTLNDTGQAILNQYGSGNHTGTLAYTLGVDSSGNLIEFSGGSGGSVSSITNGADNRIATFTGADSLNGEANLTFDGDIFAVNTDELYVSGSRVGIGLTNPSVTLHVDGFARLNGGLQLNQNGAAQIYQIQNNALRFGTNNTERMRILADGKVGIGTTSPDVVLHVESADETVARFERNDGSGFTAIDIKDGVGTSGNSAIRFSDTGGSPGEINYEHADNSLRINTNSSERLRITSTGNVGIGTTNPLYKLQIAGSTYVNSGTLFIDSGNRLTWGNSQQSIRAVDSSTMTFQTGNSDRMFLTATGDLQVTGKVLDADIKVPNQNLLDIGSLKISNRNDIYSNATKTTIDEFKATYANDGTGASTIRLYVDDGVLVDGDNYTVSVYYEGLVGTLSMDWCDTTLTGNHTSATGTTSSPASGRIYGYASRSDYDSTYRFLDINLTSGASNTVTLFHPKVEAGTVVTDFVGTERTNQEGNSKDLNNLNVTGKLGIGTTNPERQLSLYSNDTETTPRLLIEQDGTGDAVMAFSLTGGQGWSMGIDNSGGDSFMIHDSSGGVDSSSQFTITSAGNIGIGTSTPSQKLEVNGNILVNKGTTNRTAYLSDDGLYISRTTVADSYPLKIVASSSNSNHLDINARSRISLILNGTTRLVANDSGNVGIGLTTPSYKLEVDGDIQNNGVLRKAGNVYIKSTGSDTAIGPGGAGTITFHTSSVLTGAAEAMRIDADGNLLLNNTSAGARLDIREDSNYAIRAEDASGHYFRVNTGGDTEIRGDLTVQGTVIAQEFHTEFVSASIIYESGSTKFGDTTSDNHDFTGSVNVSGSMVLTDNTKLQLGSNSAAGDLRIFHNGTVSKIANNTGNLEITQFVDDGDIIFNSDDGSGGTTEYLRLDGGSTKTIFSKGLQVLDNIVLSLGSSDDLQISHNTADTWFDNYTGNINFRNRQDDGDIIFYSDDGSGGHAEYFRVDGGIHETVFSKSTRHMDNVYAKFGSGEDLKIYHSGAHSFITAHGGTGSLYIRPGNGNTVQIEDKDSNDMITAAPTGVRLLYNSSEKLTTTNTGVTVTGDIDADDITIDDWGSVSASLASIQEAGGVNGSGAADRIAIWSDSDTLTSNSALTFTGGHILVNQGTEYRSKDTGGTVRTLMRVNSSNELEYGWSANGPVKFMGGGSYAERMRIHTTGNIGIGTTNPGKKLHVAGEISGSAIQVIGGSSTNKFYSTNTGTIAEFKPSDTRSGMQPIFLYRSSVNGSANYMLANGSTTLFGLYDSGVPSDISGMVRITPNNSSEAPSVRIGDAGSNGAYLDVGGNIKLLNNGNSYINGGNVGIGTTSPNALLEIYSTGAAAPASSGTTQSAGNRLRLGRTDGAILDIGSNGGNGLWLQTGNGADLSTTYNLLLNPNGGNVGIGTTSPGDMLHIHATGNGSSALIIEDDARRLELGRDMIAAKSADGSTVQNLYIQPAGTTAFATTSGKVGIGTTGPKQQFHVHGGSSAGSVTKAVIGGTGGNGESYLYLAEHFNGDNVNYGFSFVADGNSTNNLLIKRHNNSTSGATVLTIERDASNATFHNNLTALGSLTVGDSNADSAQIGLKHLLGYCENTDVDTGTETIKELALATYQAVFFDYVVKNGTNLRAGTVTAVHDGTNVEFTDTSTKDLGSTSAVTLSVDIDGSNMRLRATTTSDNWIVKANIRGIKV